MKNNAILVTANLFNSFFNHPLECRIRQVEVTVNALKPGRGW
jgi:hypothetical protein